MLKSNICFSNKYFFCFHKKIDPVLCPFQSRPDASASSGKTFGNSSKEKYCNWWGDKLQRLGDALRDTWDKEILQAQCLHLKMPLIKLCLSTFLWRDIWANITIHDLHHYHNTSQHHQDLHPHYHSLSSNPPHPPKTLLSRASKENVDWILLISTLVFVYLYLKGKQGNGCQSGAHIRLPLISNIYDTSYGQVGTRHCN